jgi:hypothetical protein
MFTPSFAPPSIGNNTPDPHNSADSRVVPDIQSSSVASETLPANTQLSSASPAFRIDQVAAAPGLHHSTSTTAISLTRTSVLQPGMEPNDGRSDNDYIPLVSEQPNNVETPQRDHESESVPNTAIDASPHAASFS